MVSLIPRKGPPTPPSSLSNITIRDRSRSLTGAEPVAISIGNGDNHEADSSDSDVSTPRRSRPWKEANVRGDSFEKEDQRSKGKHEGESLPEKQNISLDFLHSSTSLLQPRLRLLESPTSSQSVPPFSSPVILHSSQLSEKSTRVLKSFVVFFKVFFSLSYSISTEHSRSHRSLLFTYFPRHQIIYHHCPCSLF